MEYIALLASAVRLLDLHDSRRGYGESEAFTAEKRPGHPDGVYLDIAVLVIERLKQLDDSAHQEYLPFSEIFRHVRVTRPNANESDVAYVVGVLRRPTELFYITRPSFGVAERHSEKRRTALIEKTDYADEYRLSPTGRALPALANAARNAAYVRGDAYNLLHATQDNDYRNIAQFADEIVCRLRAEMLNIHAALEKIGRVDTIERYLDNFEQWRKIIAETIDIVRRTEERLDSGAFRQDLDDWVEKSKSDLTFFGLQREVLRVRQVLTAFNRLLFDLVEAVMKERRIAIPPPSFRDFAIRLVRNPFPDVAEKHFLRQWGACKLEALFHSPLDALGAVQKREKPQQVTALVFEDEIVEPVSQMGKLRFLDRHGAAIVRRLRAGPLALSDAIDDGLFQVDDSTMIGDLVGVFVAPASLDIKGAIDIRVASSLRHTQVNGDDYLFTNLELHLTEAPREQQ